MIDEEFYRIHSLLSEETDGDLLSEEALINFVYRDNNLKSMVDRIDDLSYYLQTLRDKVLNG